MKILESGCAGFGILLLVKIRIQPPWPFGSMEVYVRLNLIVISRVFVDLLASPEAPVWPVFFKNMGLAA